MKEFKTFEEQVDKLINDKKLIVDDKEKAISFFERYNYYAVSGYHINYRRYDIFNPGITINHIYNAFFFDMDLRRLLFELCENFENMLKTKVAYYYAMSNDPSSYFDINNFDFSYLERKFNLSFTYDEKVAKLNEIFLPSIEYLKNNNPKIYEHHIEKYDGKLPIWVVIMYMTFGDVIKLLELLKRNEKILIAANILKDKILQINELLNYSKCICSLRNKCAHGDRIFDSNFSKNVLFNEKVKNNLLKEKININTIGYTLYG